MLVKIDGIVQLPTGVSEDRFNLLFLQFMESNRFEFGGGTQVVNDTEETE